MNLEENLQAVENKIRVSCARARRERGSVGIIAVTKTHPPETVRLAILAGLSVFGESKVQEAKAKIPEVGGQVRWDLIGHLQTNKAKDAVRLFDLIHSVDSVRLGEAIEQAAAGAAKTQRILIEVNVSGEKSKFGLPPGELSAALEKLNALPHLAVEGLMTLAPLSEDAEKARPYFRRLRELRDKASKETGIPLPQLSMGMSGDYEQAIEEGATLVRIGSALFGERRASNAREVSQD